MIAAWKVWSGDCGRISDRIAASLGIFAGVPASFWREDDVALSFLPGPRIARRQHGWRPARTQSGARVVLHGRIDNLGTLCADLRMPVADPAAVYGAAVDRWGDEADRRVIGDYAAIVACDDTVRLSRSPWNAPPLHYAQFDGQLVAASVLRVLLAAGLPEKPDEAMLVDNLYFNLTDRERSWLDGARRVPGGSVVTLSRTARNVFEWYDPGAIVPVRLPDDGAYLDAANGLLEEAVRKTTRGVSQPAMSLSGGLDSPIVADEVMRQMSGSSVLHGFTSIPLDEWQGRPPRGYMPTEQHMVEAFAAGQERLRLAFTQNPGGSFDDKWQDFFVAMHAAPNHLCNYDEYHGVFADARRAGCDAMITGDFGNQTFSNAGRWAYGEFLRTGRFGQLWHLLRTDKRSGHSPLRRFLALSILQSMPAPVRDAVRRVIHPRRATLNESLSLMPADRNREARDRLKNSGGLHWFDVPRDRREDNRIAYYWADGHGTDVDLAFEQVYGMRIIHVPAYRPLVEFCMGLPTDQLVRNGVSRYLARRMAKGRLPDSMSQNLLKGLHNADRHLRMSRRLPDLMAMTDAIAADPHAGSLIDVGKVRAVLDDWPESLDPDGPQALAIEAGVPRAMLTARYLQFLQGRNSGPESADKTA